MYLTSVIYLICGIAIFLLGLVILRENSRQRINRVTAFMMFFAALGPILGAFGLLAERQTPGVGFSLDFLRRLFLMWEFFFPLLLFLALIFPREHPIVRRFPRVYILLFLPYAFHFLIVLLFRGPEDVISLVKVGSHGLETSFLEEPLSVAASYLLRGVGYFLDIHVKFFALFNLLYVTTALFLMYSGYTKLESPRFKRQVGLVLWGIVASVELYTIAFLLPKVAPIRVGETYTQAITVVALVVGVGAIAWAIIRYQFLDIRLIIRRSIVLSVGSGVLLGVYLLIYGQARRAVAGLFGFDVPLLELLFLIVAVFSFHPLLGALETRLEKILARDRADYRNVLQSLSRDIVTILDMEQLKHKIVKTLRDSMSVRPVHLLVPDGHGDFVPDSRSRMSLSHDSQFVRILIEAGAPIALEELLVRIEPGPEMQQVSSLGSQLFVPLVYRGELEGMLCLGGKESGTAFSVEDATMLSVLSGQIAIALENAKLYEERLEKQRIEEEIAIAQNIQRMLLPRECPRNARFETHAMNIPSKEVGGDYYDFVELSGERVGIAIGDISGKGIPASMLMSNLQAAVRASAMHSTKVGRVMAEVNNHIARITSPEKYATLLYGILDVERLTFAYANGGHNYPILRAADGTQAFLQSNGLIVGVRPKMAYKEYSVQLHPGDTLVLYTDGISEAMNSDREEYGEERLMETIRRCESTSAKGYCDRIYKSVSSFVAGADQYDDLTLVVVKIN